MGIFNKKELVRIGELEVELKKSAATIKKLSQYKGIVSVDDAIAKKQSEFEKKQKDHEGKVHELELKFSALQEQYGSGRQLYSDLKKQIDIYTETLNLADYGMYEPHFDFDTSDKFKEKIAWVRDRQKAFIRDEEAVMGGDTITWNGSLPQGQAMVKREKKLMLRAFNGECDSFVSSVDWNNIGKMLERVEKSFEAINKVFEKQDIAITSRYKKLKEDELRLTYEYRLKRHEEKEEQRAARELMREEEKVQRDIEAAQIKADKEEVMYQKAIAKVRKDLEANDSEVLRQQVAELEEKLRITEETRERALSMAQQTRRGHVYIISNIGSFGEGMYKIGMTRRLDPMDRVIELGDASVPFGFDVHAMIFSEDAPALETALHKAFHHRRVNMINMRREFFHVSLDEIASVVQEKHGVIEFVSTPEAMQYRETCAMKQERDAAKEAVLEEQFPETLAI